MNNLKIFSQHRQAFPPDEYATLQQSVADMVSQLDAACHQSTDLPERPSITVSYKSSMGKRGRPRTEIDPVFLSQALELRGPTHLAPVFGCSSRTIRRRALENGLAQPGEPVYRDQEQPDGTITRTFHSSTRPVSNITNAQLDSLITEILEVFPAFGRRMITGRLKAAGHHVPRERIAASFIRVHGSPGIFGDRSIHRKIYKVAGANSLAHHDGQHGESFGPSCFTMAHSLALHYQGLFASRLSFTALLTENPDTSLVSKPVTITVLRLC